jgi:hypothetical protein
MDFLGSTLPEFLDRVILELRSPDDRVLTQDDTVSADDFLDGNEFHGGDKVSDFLGGRCVTSPISRRIFHQGSPIKAPIP